jgi:tetratricopeptide (TPR) repeat protein
MKNNKTRIAALLLAAFAVAGAAAAPLDDMRRLVDSGQFEQAVMLAQRHPELIGDVHFDFLYGVAAIAAGRAAEGLLALERHLAAVPANDRARLELARGYFQLGEFARAREEFEFVLRYNPTPATRRTIESFLNAMQLRGPDAQGSTRVYFDAGIGYDSNVNLAPREDRFELFDATLARPLADGFLSLGAGVQQQWRVSPRFSVFAGADIDLRQPFKERDYSLDNIAFNAGFTQLGAATLYRFTLGLAELRVGGERYRDTLSVGGEATWTRGGGASVGASAQYFEYRHSNAESQRDARAVALALTYSDNWPRSFGAPQVALRLGWTGESNRAARPDLARDVLLVRAFGAVTPTQQLRLTGSLSGYGIVHRGADLLIGSTRKDAQLVLDLLANVALDPRWSVRAEWQSAWTRSNQDLYDSDRHALTFKTRYQY